MGEFSGANYVPLSEIGASWSTPQGEFGLGHDGSIVTIGEFSVPKTRAHIGTVTLGITTTANSIIGAIGWLHAQIQWGAGNAQYFVEIDWANGQSISIPLAYANAVTVRAIQYGAFDRGFSLNASFVLGPRAAREHCTNSTLVAIQPGAAGIPSSVLINVPPRAKTLYVPRCFTPIFGSASPSDIQISAEHYGVGPLGIWSHQVATDSAIWTSGVELPPFATIVRVLSLHGTPGYPFPAQQVVFGIDG